MSPDLASGEEVRVHWQVSRRSLAQRTLVIVFVTGLIPGLLVPPQAEGWLARAATVAAVWPLTGLFYMWVFDEFRPWLDNRHRHWWLTDRAILTRDTEGQVDLPLTDIRDVRRPVPWSLVLALHSGLRVVLPLPPQPAALQRTIRAAIQAADAKGAT